MDYTRKASLAVVIPAYKSRYFSQTLESLASQTDSRFNVYVGDDCSPEDLESIVGEYRNRLNLVYRRFPENLGSSDLVSHWNRCLDMVQDEEYVCMFSDDDIMEQDCVSSFYSCIEDDTRYDVYHFDLTVIGPDGNIISTPASYPDVISSEEFFRQLYTYRIDARMPEFVFRTSALRSSGFVNFDLAFRSDNATVMSVGRPRGIRTVRGDRAHVLWRNSGINVSASSDIVKIRRMVDASICFYNWVEKFCSTFPLTFRDRIKLYVCELMRLYPAYTYSRLVSMAQDIGLISRSSFASVFFRLYLRKKIRRYNRKARIGSRMGLS